MELLNYINTRLNELKTILRILETNKRDALNSNTEIIKAKIEELEAIQTKLNFV